MCVLAASRNEGSSTIPKYLLFFFGTAHSSMLAFEQWERNKD